MDFQAESYAGFTEYIATGILSPKVQECLNSILEECSPNSSKSETFLKVIELAQSRRHKSPANATLEEIIFHDIAEMYPFMAQCNKKNCPKCTT